MGTTWKAGKLYQGSACNQWISSRELTWASFFRVISLAAGHSSLSFLLIFTSLSWAVNTRLSPIKFTRQEHYIYIMNSFKAKFIQELTNLSSNLFRTTVSMAMSTTTIIFLSLHVFPPQQRAIKKSIAAFVLIDGVPCHLKQTKCYFSKTSWMLELEASD